jgi:hypothetical protein
LKSEESDEKRIDERVKLKHKVKREDSREM